MVDTLVGLSVGILAYTVGAVAAQRWGYLPSFVEVSGPMTTIRTARGRALLDRLARHRRLWRAVTNVGLGFGLLVLVGAFISVVFVGFMLVQQPESNPVQGPADALVLPGINSYLPLSATPYIVFGLALGLIVHEGGHGLLCRVEDIDIDSMGLVLFGIVPIGAFVQPDDESQREADRGAQTRLFVAGVTNNFLLTALAVLLLFGPVAGSIQAVDGTAVGGVDPGSPIDRAGIETGDVLTEINGTRARLADGRRITVESWVYVHRAVADGPLDLAENDTIVRVDDDSISREGEFLDALENQTKVTLRTANGDQVTGPIGAYAREVTDGGPLAAAGAPVGTPIVITHVGDERITNASSLFTWLSAAEPGNSVTVSAVVNGTQSRYTVTLGPRNEQEGAVLGLADVHSGYSGVGVSEFGFREYPTQRNLAILGGHTELDLGLDVLQHTLWLIILPIVGMIDPSSFGFTGFMGPVTNFYTIGGPLGVLGGGVFVLATVLFWTIWANLNFALFNLIPLYPMDGGHILRMSAEAIVARTPFNRRWAVRSVTVVVGLCMFGSLMVMLFGQMVLT